MNKLLKKIHLLKRKIYSIFQIFYKSISALYFQSQRFWRSFHPPILLTYQSDISLQGLKRLFQHIEQLEKKGYPFQVMKLKQHKK